MKKALLFLLFLSLYSYGYAADIAKYYQYVYQAEDALMEGNYTLALQLYQNAFKEKDELFASDLQNALICALKTNNHPLALKYANTLADKGVGEKYFETKGYVLLQSYDEYKELLIRAKTKRIEWGQKTNLIKHQLATLYDRDQYIHGLWAESCKKGDCKDGDSMYLVMSRVDDSTSAALFKLFENENCLSEFELGAYMDDDDSSLSFWPNYFIIILHNYQGFKDADTLFTPVLKRCLTAGKLKPETFADVQDNGSNMGTRLSYGSNASNFAMIEDKLYRDKYAFEVNEWNDAIEENRKLILLYPRKDIQKRVLFNHYKNLEGFIIFSRYSTVSSFSDEESRKNYLDHYQPIE